MITATDREDGTQQIEYRVGGLVCRVLVRSDGKAQSHIERKETPDATRRRGRGR